jgi:hypothetical protein
MILFYFSRAKSSPPYLVIRDAILRVLVRSDSLRPVAAADQLSVHAKRRNNNDSNNELE